MQYDKTNTKNSMNTENVFNDLTADKQIKLIYSCTASKCLCSAGLNYYLTLKPIYQIPRIKTQDVQPESMLSRNKLKLNPKEQTQPTQSISTGQAAPSLTGLGNTGAQVCLSWRLWRQSGTQKICSIIARVLALVLNLVRIVVLFPQRGKGRDS